MNSAFAPTIGDANDSGSPGGNWGQPADADRAAQQANPARAQHTTQVGDHSRASPRRVRTYTRATAITMTKVVLPTAAPMPKWNRWNDSW